MTGSNKKSGLKRLKTIEGRAVEPLPLWTPDLNDPDNTDEEYHFFPDWPSELTRVTSRIKRDPNGRVIDFAYMVDCRDNEQSTWEKAFRIDCAHQTIHCHSYRKNGVEIGYQVISDIKSHRDVQDGFTHAEDLVYDEWEEHRRRWSNGY